MPKNIVICLDGTWNKPDKPDQEISKETNVKNLHDLLDTSDSSKQVIYYDSGVGTEKGEKLIGGITGKGLTKNIRQAYNEVCKQYEDGDKVYLFGFSRGAFTARSVAGMIYTCGLIPKNNLTDKAVNIAFKIYKKGSQIKKGNFKKSNTQCPIEFIGVWDTVGALGIPVGIFKSISKKRHQFHDVYLNTEIKNAYHAIAIDEERKPYIPTLWKKSNQSDNQVLEQVWFAGVHSDIGGGYPDRHHSDITFKWMLEKIGDRLNFNGNEYKFKGDVSKPHHDSFKLYYLKRHPRKAPANGDDIPQVHTSVADKLKARSGYVPLALVDLIGRDSLAPYKEAK